MRALLQRVTSGSVTVDGEVVGAIGPGLVILLGVKTGNTSAEVKWLADKCVNLRIFSCQAGNLFVADNIDFIFDVLTGELECLIIGRLRFARAE